MSGFGKGAGRVLGKEKGAFTSLQASLGHTHWFEMMVGVRENFESVLPLRSETRFPHLLRGIRISPQLITIPRTHDIYHFSWDLPT